MGIDKGGRDSKDYAAGFAAGFAAAREIDFSCFDRPYRTPEHATAVGEADTGGEGFPAVTAEDLAHLTPGCFVQVGTGDDAYWVEIGQINGDTISGMLHPELSSPLCLVDHDVCEVARFNRDQITALGCDRYCWC